MLSCYTGCLEDGKTVACFKNTVKYLIFTVYIVNGLKHQHCYCALNTGLLSKVLKLHKKCVIFPLVYKLQLFWHWEVENSNLWRAQMAVVCVCECMLICVSLCICKTLDLRTGTKWKTETETFHLHTVCCPFCAVLMCSFYSVKRDTAPKIYLLRIR